MTQTEIIKRIKEIVVNADSKATAILYGSRARGDARPDSDYDVLILIDEPRLNYDNESKFSWPLYQLEMETGVRISPIIRTLSQWKNPPIKTPFHINVNNEGIVL